MFLAYLCRATTFFPFIKFCAFLAFTFISMLSIQYHEFAANCASTDAHKICDLWIRHIWQVCGANNCLSEFGHIQGAPGLWGEDDDCCTRLTWSEKLLHKSRSNTFEGSADLETCALMARYRQPLIQWINCTWQKFTLGYRLNVFEFFLQGTCYTDYDCVTPGFHICVENCTERYV